MTDTNWQAEMRAKAEWAAHELMGTCQAIYNLGEEFEGYENDATFCAVLDEKVFCCTACGWWEEQPAHEHPESGEWICEGCAAEGSEE